MSKVKRVVTDSIRNSSRCPSKVFSPSRAPLTFQRYHTRIQCNDKSAKSLLVVTLVMTLTIQTEASSLIKLLNKTCNPMLKYFNKMINNSRREGKREKRTHNSIVTKIHLSRVVKSKRCIILTVVCIPVTWNQTSKLNNYRIKNRMYNKIIIAKVTIMFMKAMVAQDNNRAKELATSRCSCFIYVHTFIGFRIS